MKRLITSLIVTLVLVSCASKNGTMSKKESVIQSATQKENAIKKEEAIKRLTAIAMKEYQIECKKVKTIRSRIATNSCTTKAQREQIKRDAEEYYRQAVTKRNAINNSEG